MTTSLGRLVAVLWVLWALLAFRFLFTAMNGEDDPKKARNAHVAFWLAFVVTALVFMVGV